MTPPEPPRFEEPPFDAPDAAFPDSALVVLKFGGTSVSTAPNWETIAAIVAARRADGLRPLVVHSALSGISNALEELIETAVRGESPSEALEAIAERHRALGRDLGIDGAAAVADTLGDLERWAAGVALVGEASPRVRARILAAGELMATSLGAAWLNARGLGTTRLDARDLLRARDEPRARERVRWLSASCDFDADPELARRLDAAPGILLTQGFIAGGADGETVLLGRGGSDTSAAYLAAKLSARRLEIWTDVPGMYSADPRTVPSARLLRALRYREAQEIASTGSKVLHPRCIPPVRAAGIPLFIRSTLRPDLDGTTIAGASLEDDAQLKAISVRRGIVLISMETLGMWQEVGFLAEATARIAAAGISIDLVSTSESNVTVSIDTAAGAVDAEALARAVRDLEEICRVQTIERCAAVSLVGRRVRAILHELGPALEAFREHRIHLVSQAANDLNLTVVVDDAQATRLAQDLHRNLIARHAPGDVFGDTWESFQSPAAPARPPAARRRRRGARGRGAGEPWWIARREELLALAGRHGPAYVYDRETVRLAARALRALDPVDRVHYAVKANPHPALLETLHEEGVHFECVSPGEIERVRGTLSRVRPADILFTPNFAPRAEYIAGFEQGVRVTVDNLEALRAWPDVFHGREILVRLDPGRGRGHHAHVRTAGAHSKFGVPRFELDELAAAARAAGAEVVGLHAHAGSGIFRPETWGEVGAALLDAAARFPACARSTSAAGSACPSAPAIRRSISARWRSSSPASAARVRISSCGSSPAATSSPPRACCSRGSRSGKGRVACATSASRPE